MAPLDWLEVLKQEISSLKSAFSEDELAYFALTSKVEHSVRDRLAYRLHRRFEAFHHLHVCREWRRFDLAALEEGEPSLLLELKAMYSFDMFKTSASTEYPNAVQRDVEKLLAFRSERLETRPALFTMLLATHPHTAPHKQLHEVVKYSHGVSRFAPSSTAAVGANVKQHFRNHPLAAEGEIDGGKAFGIQVSVHYWLFGPYPNAAKPGAELASTTEVMAFAHRSDDDAGGSGPNAAQAHE